MYIPIYDAGCCLVAGFARCRWAADDWHGGDLDRSVERRLRHSYNRHHSNHVALTHLISAQTTRTATNSDIESVETEFEVAGQARVYRHQRRQRWGGCRPRLQSGLRLPGWLRFWRITWHPTDTPQRVTSYFLSNQKSYNYVQKFSFQEKSDWLYCIY